MYFEDSAGDDSHGLTDMALSVTVGFPCWFPLDSLLQILRPLQGCEGAGECLVLCAASRLRMPDIEDSALCSENMSSVQSPAEGVAARRSADGPERLKSCAEPSGALGLLKLHQGSGHFDIC